MSCKRHKKNHLLGGFSYSRKIDNFKKVLLNYFLATDTVMFVSKSFPKVTNALY